MWVDRWFSVFLAYSVRQTVKSDDSLQSLKPYRKIDYMPAFSGIIYDVDLKGKHR